MRLDDMPESTNVDDRRGEGGGFGGGGYGGGFGIPGGGLGIGGIVVLGLVGWALGIPPWMLISGLEMLGGGGNQSQYQQPYRAPQNQPTDQQSVESRRFVSRVLGSTEVVWKDIFAKDGQTYRAPRLEIFNRQMPSACGQAQSAMGPFYCPNDRQVYLDVSFFRDLEVRFRGCSGKACDFSKAYVIAHEVGHHVQNSLGILPKVQQAQRATNDRAASNRLQVRVELQADCFAGVWANHAEAQYKFLDPGDIDAALQTAAAIGDDTLQRRSRGAVVPDSFTHGSAEQRKRWFTNGFKGGTIASCNTFSSNAQL